MLKVVFLQFGNEQGAYDVFMKIGDFFSGFQFQMANLASNLFGMFGF